MDMAVTIPVNLAVWRVGWRSEVSKNTLQAKCPNQRKYTYPTANQNYSNTVSSITLMSGILQN